MQSCSEKATNVRLIDDMRNGCRFQILKAGETEQTVLAGGDKTKHSVVSETQRGEICLRKSL